MSEILRKILRNKEILILGFGREGQTTYKVLRNLFPGMHLAIADRDKDLSAKFPELKADSNLCLQTGAQYLDKLQQFDMIIKSPGISPMLFPMPVPAENLTSQTELFIRAFRDQIIGVTGTKGKSTTSSLIAHLMQSYFPDVILAGNIGIPPFGLLDSIGPETWVVYEMSSHQLEQTRISPHIAVLLNIFEEHLDHYESYEAYQQAKLNIGRHQQPGDYLVYVADNEILNRHIKAADFPATLLPVSLKSGHASGYGIDGSHIYFGSGTEKAEVMALGENLPLKGDHNLLNIIVSAAVCHILGMPGSLVERSLTDFSPLEHRMEYAGLYQGIHFYNDSIATIPEATLAAIAALQEVDTLILGGMDRGIDYTGLVAALPGTKIRNIILVGAAGSRIRALLELSGTNQFIFTAQDYAEVVGLAMAKTARGKICLLSPAAASYDWFRNFEERGSVFKRLVSDIPA